MTGDGTAATLDRISRLAEARGLLEVTVGTSHGRPALKVREKTFVVVRDADELSLLVPIDIKEMLIEMAPDIYYETEHFKGWPAVIVRLPPISDAELSLRLEDAWRSKAPRRLLAMLDGR